MVSRANHASDSIRPRWGRVPISTSIATDIERRELVGSSLPTEPHPPNNFPKYRDKMRERRNKHGKRSESYFKSQLQSLYKTIFTKK